MTDMDWVQPFYQAQNDWMGVYLEPVEERDEERVALLHRCLGSAPKRLLELGAGGGQTAVALARAGHAVTAVELLHESVQHARQLAEEEGVAPAFHEGDFYTLDLGATFDAVLYWDSFGIGTDADQRRLLRRIRHEWLAPGGRALIEVGTPWYWSSVANGRQMDLGACWREYGFDTAACRLVDRWWRKTAPERVVSQSLRCYHPADLRLLLEGTGLALQSVHPGDAMVYEPEVRWLKNVSLEECMTYYAILVPC